ncbi:HNH endonuclease signature motif containing protein [Antrihabitans stalactiti]|uniref:DUF222 domain-containing protein n=1 Tax=Antrihabitans stalactiti TaxID=2584121 RepID=A0A848KK27_9NOCA|nr:HNH endonuclease signature motif containing protein [Antrihabitans stalactiti]NMN98196.1 DUF222 domain-containing protein [Antrihabitans stalactiti]
MGLGEVLEVIDTLDTVEPWRYSTTELMTVLPELSGAIHSLEALRVALVAELDKHGVPGGLGATSTATWLANRTSLSPGESNRILRLGVALDAHPDIAAAYQAKLITADAARLIVAFLEKPPPGMPVEAVDSVRTFLLDAAHGGDLRELRVHIARLRETFDTDDTPASEDTDRNEFYASTTLNGRMAVKGDFDAETGEMLLAALSPLSTPRPTDEAGPDNRTPAQRRADGFTEILRRYLDSGASPDDGGERPHLHLHIQANDLAGQEPATEAVSDKPDNAYFFDLFGKTSVGRMPWMGAMSIESARRIACDSVVHPIVMDENGSPLNLGRSVRTANRKLRRALVARDGGCAFRGCGRPAAWCDAHHIQHWIDGGATDLDNLVLLCRFHHRLIHHSEWEVVMGRDRHPWFIPPARIDPLRRPIAAHGRANPQAA